MSNNVLWAGYRVNCYVGETQFVYAMSDLTRCYFGKLKPSTTYTITRLDTSNRLRIGVGASDMSGVYTSIDTAYTQYFDKTSDPINMPFTFTTGASEQYITVYYTSAGDPAPRIMLNEGSTALPYEPPAPMPYSWIITDGINNNYPYLLDVPLPAETVFTEPYPRWAWQIDQFYNGGYPYLIGLRPPKPPDPPEPEPPPSIKQKPYISVFDSRETDFEHNGLRVLSPAVCEITEELNGAYELTLTHPVDTDNNWLYLNEFNIIKTQGQLFRIYKRVKSMTGDSVTVYARHIWYDLLANFVEDARPTLLNGQGAIDWILGNTHEEHNFIGVSDIADISTAYYQNMSPVLSFLGADNAFITRWGGELYRDNFNFSINTRRGKDNAFNIRYGVDMLAIDETVDFSEFCSTLIAEDNFGNRIKIYSVPNPSPYRHVKKLIFNYDINDRTVLQADARAYMDTYNKPSINYTVTFANLKNLDGYKDFIGLQRCEIGDTGIIHNQRLDISNVQKIVKKTVDGITGDVISVELGTAKGTITRPKKFTNTMSPQDTTYVLMQQVYRELQENIAKTSPTWKSCRWAWNRLHLVAWKKFK